MPELPEVETVVKSLEPIIGNQITASKVYQSQLRIGCKIPKDFSKLINLSKIKDIKRIAKYIVIELSNSEVLIIHLGMSGNLLLKEKDYKAKKHDHVIISFKDSSIVFRDPRRFGAIFIIKNQNLDAFFKDKKIGIDALSSKFTPKYLKATLKGRKTPIKTSLLNQKIVAGLGNIYVCEALFLCGINPCTASNDLTEKELETLVPAIKNTLKKSIKAGGTTLKDHKSANGTPGYFSQELLVYGKENQPCPECNTNIQKIIIGGRSTFFCPKCQK